MGATKTIVSKAMMDPSFRKQLLDDPKRAVEALGIQLPAGVTLQVHENSASVVHVVLPELPSGQALSDRDLDAVAGGATLASATKLAAPALKPLPGVPLPGGDGGLLPPLPGGGLQSPIGMGTFGPYTGCCS